MRAAILLAAWSCLPAVVAAQVDPRGDWRTWHTDHFNVHARVELAEIARTAASEAERAWAALSAELKPPRGTVDLTLYDNVDFSNGFATVFPSNRISIFLTPPAGEVGLGQYDEWLRLVLTHELTHLFHLDRSAGVWGLAQHVFGRAPLLFPNLYRPGWVLEGVATYYESRMTAGGRGRGGFHGQLLAAASAEGRWPKPGDANFSNSRWPSGLEPYAWGSRFFLWEAATHGDSVMPRFIERTSHRFWPLTISGPLKNAGGGGLYPDWRSFRASWDSATLSPDTATVVARGLRFEPKPRVSADGSRLAWVQADGKRRERIVVRDIARGTEAASRAVNGAPEISWAGAALLFSELDFASPVEIRSGLFRWTPGGAVEPISSVRRLTRPFSVGPARVGAVRITQGTTVLVSVDGARAEPLPVPPADGWAHVSLSPDGRRLAGARHLHGQWDIVWWPIDAPGEVRAVTDDDALDDEPSWSANGSSIVFTSERTGLPQIFAYRVADGSLAQLTRESTGARDGGMAGDVLYFSTVLHDGYAVMSRPLDPMTPDPVAPAESPVVLQPAEVAIRESRYSAWSSLAPRYWLPTMHDAGSTGFFLGATTSGSDVVGRTAWAGAVAHATTNNRWEGFVSLSHTRWSALLLDATASQAWELGALVPPVLARGNHVFVHERNRAAALGLTMRRRRWRSDVSLRLAGELTEERHFVPAGVPLTFADPLLAGGVISASAGRVNRQSESISPEDGAFVSGTYRRRWAVDGSGGSSELRGTVRAFLGLPLPGFANWVLAGRVAAAMSEGPYARYFALGGTSGANYSIIPGVGVGGGFRDFGLRGYPAGPSQHTRAVAGVAELRIPLFLIGKAIGRLPLSLDRVSLSIYGEAAGGWTGAGPKQLARYRDAGAELVTDVGINLDAPLRVRVGAAQALSSGLGANEGDWRAYVALGSAF